mmetsp:Transcript_57853/g.113868  ORF Transcript_57853/g.113868 Transcript_57853/m.113868 type:complete len:252 (-) Transcript_57853:169-924(-)
MADSSSMPGKSSMIAAPPAGSGAIRRMRVPSTLIVYFCGKWATAALRIELPRPVPNSYHLCWDQSSTVRAKLPTITSRDVSSCGKLNLTCIPLPIALRESRIMSFCSGPMLHFPKAPGSSIIENANIVPNCTLPRSELMSSLEDREDASTPTALCAKRYTVEAQICWKYCKFCSTQWCMSIFTSSFGASWKWMSISVPSPKKPVSKPAVMLASAASLGTPSGNALGVSLLKKTLRRAMPTSVPKRVAFLSS